MTTGIGKPAIRGMTHYRVVTLDNGRRSETQAWGHDHSPNVETATAERVEVIQGPASVLYGSDALGEVINVVAPPVPDAVDGPRFARGRLTMAYDHNNRAPDATALAEGPAGGVGARLAVAARGGGDMRTPGGPPGYTTATLGAGSSRATPRGATTVDLTVRNLLHARYRSFMSRYKEFALAPGRAVVVRVTTGF